MGTSAVFLRIPCNLSTALLSRRGSRGSHSTCQNKISDFPEGNKKPGRGGQVLGECLGIVPGPRSSIMLYANQVNLWGRMASRGAVHRL